jgi:hypothetical protein
VTVTVITSSSMRGNSIISSSSRIGQRQRWAQRLSNSMGIVEEWTNKELVHGVGNLLWEHIGEC